MSKNKITVITLTGDRNKVFELTRQHILAQTIQPDQWIIVDDGFEPLPERLGTDTVNEDIIDNLTEECALNNLDLMNIVSLEELKEKLC